MKRNAQKSIENWFLNNERKHLYITGMRGTGKTTLIRDFLEKNAGNRVLYLNFETDHKIRSVFADHFQNEAQYSGSITDILSRLYNIGSESLNPDHIILDEVHTMPKARELFRRACNTTEQRLIFIDSENPVPEKFFESDPLLDEAFLRMRLFPLTFDEFLINTGREWYHDVIAGHYERMRPVPELVHNEINDILSDYLIIGGLPETVQKYIDNKYSLENLEVEEYQLREFRNIRSAAEEYCNMDKTKAEALLNGSVAQQLDDSRHFAFQRLVKGSSYSYYKQEISALCDAGILLRSFFADHFRFFWPDTGLLNMKINGCFSAEQTIRDEVIVKNYIAQQLASGGIRLEYWCSKNSARIDHVTSYNGRKIALKYVGSSKKRIRPLQIFDKENNADEMIAITDSNFYIMGKLKFIPLYAVFCLFR